MTTGIYGIQSPSGKMYIGSAANIERRVAKHLSCLRHKKHFSVRLSAAWARYDGKGFQHVVLEECAVDQLLAREQHWIDTLKPSYNARTCAERNDGVKTSDRQKAVAREMGQRPEQIERIAKGSKSAWSDPVKKAARVAAMRAWWTPERRAEQAARQAGVDKGKKAREVRWARHRAREAV